MSNENSRVLPLSQCNQGTQQFPRLVTRQQTPAPSRREEPTDLDMEKRVREFMFGSESPLLRTRNTR